MGSEEHEGASSSRNGKFLDRIEHRPGGRSRVHLRDGTYYSVADNDLSRIPLEPHSDISDQVIHELEYASSLVRAEEKALELLGNREHSVRQLREKLIARRFDREVVGIVCQRLADRGQVDDLRFASEFLHQRTRMRNYGLARLKAALMSAGVDRETIAQACSVTLPANYDEEAFDRAVSAIERKGTMSSARVGRRLNSLGFAAAKIRRYLERRESREV